MGLIGEVLDRAWVNLMSVFNVETLPQSQLFSATILLVLGFIGGRVLSEVLRTLLKMTALDDLAVKSDIQILLRKLSYRGTISDFIADFVRWTIYLLTVFSVFYLFGFRFITGYSELLVQWVSRAIIALLVLIGGVLISEHIERITVRVFRTGRMAPSVDETEAEIPVYMIAGRLTRYAGYIITFLIALGVLGADILILNILMGVFGLGAVLLLVLSFRDLTRNIAISSYFQLSRVFTGGETVQIGDHEGEIIGIRLLYTKLKSGQQTYYIPNTRLVSEVIEHKGE